MSSFKSELMIQQMRLLFLPMFFLIFFSCSTNTTSTESKVEEATGPWNGKSAAIALTYDDGLHVHLDNVIPVLDRTEIRGTFYLNTNADSFKKRSAEWKAASHRGHELGNHTIYHPCIGKSKGRDWVTPERDLDNYTLEQMLQEIKDANSALRALDGKSQRSFAYTCGDTSAGNDSFVDDIRGMFTSARGVSWDFNPLQSTDLFYLNAHSMNRHTAADMKAIVDEAIASERLAVFLFHGVGGEHNLNVSREDHDELIKYIMEKEAEVWVAPLADISAFMQSI